MAIEIQQASEPSDIIWENRHFTPADRFKKTIVVVILIFLALFISFILIFAAKKYEQSLLAVYPSVQCDEFEIYGDSIGSLAESEYNVQHERKEADKTVRYTGYVQCYCKGLDGADPIKVEDVSICEEYEFNAFLVLGITNVVTGFIVVVNTILKEFAVRLITWIGYDTHSELITKITNGVFIALFFNTAIILLLVNANFAQYHLPLDKFFNGRFSDYEVNWFRYVGYPLTQTMILNAGMPVGIQWMNNTLKWFSIRMD